MAIGGKPIVPSIPGVEKEGISPLKTMADAEKIYGLKGKKAVVIGAGSIGVETSISFKRRGMEICLIEQLGHVLPTVFDEEAASIVTKRIEALGIKTYSGEKAIQFTGNGHVRSVVTDAREIQCDIVVLSVGIKPAIELARKEGIETGSLGGIKVSDQMMTNLPEIYAAGDVTETFDISRNTNWINAIWPCAVEKGRVAGLNMAGHGHVVAAEPKNAQVFFSIYFMMTGLHGIHVLGGMALMIWLVVRSLRGAFTDGYFTPVDMAGLYWHLVDLIWIYLFLLLYLIH